MLCGKVTEEQLHNKRIEREIKENAHKVRSEMKLLLLGTGESGKSTVAKQMKIMHLNGFTDKEKATYKAIVHTNIIEAVTTLVKQTHTFGLPLSEKTQEFASHFVKDGGPGDVSEYLNQDTARNIAELWKEESIQRTYERRSEYQLPGSVDYLMENVERLLSPTVEVNETDILHCRMRTTGVIEIEFVVEKVNFRMVDVGGQRSERKKWFHCFSQVTAVLFCVALNEYDEKLYEDETVNRMVEALTLFEEVSNSKFFSDVQRPTQMILFLNKSDLFREKIKKVPLTTLFPRYKGGTDFDAAVKYIKRKFTEKCKNKDKLIFSHVTCATDTENVRVVFDAVRVSLVHNSLNGAGMV